MNMEQYYLRFPTEHVWCAERLSNVKTTQGMLEFNESADCWAHPFNKSWAYFSIMDGKLMEHAKYKLPTLKELEHKARHAHYYFPHRFFLSHNSVMSEHRIANLFAGMTAREIDQYEKSIANHIKECYTVEKPFRLYLCGNDDCSYSKYLAQLSEAEEELVLLEACQPLDFEKDIIDNGFVFTN